MLAHLHRSRFISTSTMLASSKIQVSEFDPPTDIITHCPSLEICFPFHTEGMLYHSPPDPDKAIECHNNFRKVLSRLTEAKVWTVREILSRLPLERLRELLFSFSSVRFDVQPGRRTETEQDKFTTKYILDSLSLLQADNLIDHILLRPRIVIDSAAESPTGFRYGKIPLQPLANLTFTRDQQITTAKGVVIGRFGAVQRVPENSLMREVWPHLGIEPIYSIEEPGTLEGGDFYAVSKDLAMLGVGLRTNEAGAQQLLCGNYFGTTRVVLVEDVADLDIQRMHLDTFFNICDEQLCVCLKDIAEDHPRYLRIAHEYRQEGSEGQYRQVSKIPFGEWLKKEGYTVVKATHEQQDAYFFNFLNLGRNSKGTNTILGINKDLEKAIREAGFDGQVETIDFSGITSMYGGVHCSTQVLRKSLTG
jgi:arginine deiminase